MTGRNASTGLPVLFISIMAVIMLFIPGSSCQAAGKVIIKPLFTAQWRVDSNYFLAEDNEREAFTYLYQPGIDLGYRTDRTKLLFHYTLNAYYFEDRGGDLLPGQRSADDDDYIGHTLTFTGRHKATDRLLIGLDDSFYKTRDPAETDPLGNTVDQRKYYINRLTPLIFYDLSPRWTVGLRYRNTILDYTEDDNEDAHEDRGIFNLMYNLSRTSSLDLEYQRWKRYYDELTSDYTSDQINLIFRKTFKYAALELGGGYHERDFDDPRYEKIETVNWIASVLFQENPEELEEDEKEPKSYLRLTTERNFNDQGTGDKYYTATTFAVNAGRIFFEKIKTDLNGYYQISDYERTFGLNPAGVLEKRKDKTYHVSLDLGYIFTEWLTFSIAGGYKDRDSNLSGYDYVDKYFLVRLDFGLDLGRKGEGD